MEVSVNSEWQRKDAKNNHCVDVENRVTRKNGTPSKTCAFKQTEMLGKTNAEVDVVGVDKAVSDLSEEELRDVLEQVIDHKIPESEKCPLVRRLTEKAKDESSLEPCFGISSLPSSFPPMSSSLCTSSAPQSLQNNARKVKNSSQKVFSKEAEQSLKSDRRVQTSQSLQDLDSFCVNFFVSSSEKDQSMRAVGSKKQSKVSPANSYAATLQSAAYGGAKCESECISDLSKRCSSASGKMFNNNTKNNRVKGCKSKSGNLLSSNASVVDTHLSTHAGTCDELNSNDSSLHASSSHDLNGDSYCRKVDHCDNEHKKLTLDVKMSKQMSLDMDECPREIEMQELGRKAEIVEYSSKGIVNNHDSVSEETNLLSKFQNNYRSVGNVDSFVEIGALKAAEPVKTMFAERVVDTSANGLLPLDANEGFPMNDERKAVQSLLGKQLPVIVYFSENVHESESAVSCLDHDIDRSRNKPAGLSSGDHSHATAVAPQTDDNYNYNTVPLLSRSQQFSTSTQQTSKLESSKKKKKVEETKLAEQIEGHIGYKDVDFLTSYVSGDSANSGNKHGSSQNGETKNGNTTSNARDIGHKKKEKAMASNAVTCNASSARKKGALSESENEQKQLNASEATDNDIPANADFANSKFSNDVAQESVHENTATSRDDSSSNLNKISSISQTSTNNDYMLKRDESGIASDARNTLLSDEEPTYAASDSEMPEPESGFQVFKPKHYRRRKGGRKDDIRFLPLQRSSLPSGTSSTSTTPSFTSSTSNSTNAVTARGYESEREYCADEYRRRQDRQVHRKLACSMPHSEQNSADNSDVESSCSYPVTRRLAALPSVPATSTSPSSVSSTPKASYADIAKMGSVFSMNPTAVTFKSDFLVTSELVPSKAITTSSAASDSVSSFSIVNSTSHSTNTNHLVRNNSLGAETVLLDMNDSTVLKETSSEIPPTLTPNECTVNKQSCNNSVTPPPMKKSNSIPESNIKVSVPKHNPGNGWKNQNSASSLPAVIMYDDVLDDCKSSFTFGFFDDVSVVNVRYDVPATSDNTTDSTSNSVIVPQVEEKTLNEVVGSRDKASPKCEFPRKFNIGSKPPSLDVDMTSFNYNQIINYIRSAWENVLREVQNVSTDGDRIPVFPRHVSYYQLSQ